MKRKITMFTAIWALSTTLVLSETIRPLRLTVVDAATKVPLSNVIVYYQLEGARMGHFLGFPVFDPILYRDIVCAKYLTSTNGCVDIEKRPVRLRLYEKVLWEIIYVNLDVKTPVSSPSQKRDYPVIHPYWNESFLNPDTNFCGAVLSSRREENGQSNSVLCVTNRGARYKAYVTAGSLSKSQDQVVVELEPRRGGEGQALIGD